MSKYFKLSFTFSKVNKLIKPGKKYRRPQVVTALRQIVTEAITKIGLDALGQMSTYKRLNVLPQFMDAFEKGLGFEIGLYLFSKYRIFSNGMCSSISERLSRVKIKPTTPIQVQEWLSRSPVKKELKYDNLFKFNCWVIHQL